MIALFDTGFLYVLFDANAKIPPARDMKPIARGRERVEYLVHSLTEARSTKVILPAPALSEFMLLAHEDWAGYLALIRKTSVFQIAGFDVPESVELVEHWFRHGDGKRLRYGTQQTWAKLKYDRQIVAIAKTNRVDLVYSTDNDIHKLCMEAGIKSMGIEDLPMPPPQQMELPVEDGNPLGEDPSPRVDERDG